jgi:PST family polysaccharide transporter
MLKRFLSNQVISRRSKKVSFMQFDAKYKQVLKNFIALGIVQGTNFLVPLLTTPFIIQTTGINTFGVIAEVQSFMLLLVTIGDYGFNVTAVKEISIHNKNRTELSIIFGKVLTLKVLICFFLFIITVLFAFFVVSLEKRDFYLYGFFLLLGYTFFPTWFFQGIEEMKYISYLNAISKLFYVVLLYFVVKTSQDGVWVLCFLGISILISSVFSYVFAIKRYRIFIVIPSFDSILLELRKGFYVCLSHFSTAITNQFNPFLLSLFFTPQMVGYYSVAEKVVMAVWQILSVFSQAIYPRLCKIIHSFEQSLSFMKSVFIPFFVSICILCIFIFFLSDEIIFIFAREENIHSILLLKVLLFVIPIVLLNVPAYQFLLANSLQKYYFYIYISGMFIHLVVSILAVYFIGMIGICYAIIFTQIFITAGLYYMLYTKIIIKQRNKFVI